MKARYAYVLTPSKTRTPENDSVPVTMHCTCQRMEYGDAMCLLREAHCAEQIGGWGCKTEHSGDPRPGKLSSVMGAHGDAVGRWPDWNLAKRPPMWATASNVQQNGCLINHPFSIVSLSKVKDQARS